jgi:UPF0716 protein FxsA
MPIVLFLLFIVVPVVELAVLIQVGSWIGVWPTIALLLAVSVLGTWLVRREGMRAWTAFRLALAHGRVPTTEVVDGALVLFGGALLLTPGFVTDILGLALVFPPTRKGISRVIRAQARGRLLGAATRVGGRRGRGTTDAEVIDVQRRDRSG